MKKFHPLVSANRQIIFLVDIIIYYPYIFLFYCCLFSARKYILASIEKPVNPYIFLPVDKYNLIWNNLYYKPIFATQIKKNDEFLIFNFVIFNQFLLLKFLKIKK